MSNKSMPTRTFVQVEGATLCMSADVLRREMRDSPALERRLQRYTLALFDGAATNAVCTDSTRWRRAARAGCS
jgi:hypothetical protein